MKTFYTLSDLRAAAALKKLGRSAEQSPFLRTQKPARLAVIGRPVAHSCSPQMHGAALDALGMNLSYVRLHLEDVREFREGVTLLEELGFTGCNVTLPFKEEAARYPFDVQRPASQDPLVEAFGVANTIRFSDHATFNTDAGGFQSAVQERFGKALKNLRCLVLGAAGGAGRVLSYTCGKAATQGGRDLYLYNRTFASLQELASGQMARFETVLLNRETLFELDPSKVDLIVNATSLGLKADDPSPLPSGFLQSHHFVYDTTYGVVNALQSQAQSAGAHYEDGLSMLLHQGALAFQLWFDLPEGQSPLPVMRAALEDK